jgi:hypothetical protein
MYLLCIFPPELETLYDFAVLTSLTHPRKILLVVLQIGKYEIGQAKDLSAPLRISSLFTFRWLFVSVLFLRSCRMNFVA